MTPRILLVEDNDNLAQMLAKFLSQREFAVRVAGTGTEALQVFSAAELDLVLLDLRLPDLNGVEVLQKMRRTPKGATLPVIVMSGVYKGDPYVTEMRKLGVSHYLEKPFTPQLLFDAVNSALQKGGEAPAASPPASPQPKVNAVLDAYNNQRTGLLSTGSGSTIVFFSGEPVSFLCKGKEDFPSFLMERGKISLEDLKLFISRGEERLFFTQTGLLTHEELVEESRFFLMRQLVALWNTPQAQFHEGLYPPELPLVPLTLPQLLYEMYRNEHLPFDHSTFTNRFGALFPGRTQHFFRRINLLKLHADDIGTLHNINGNTTLKDIVASEPRGALFLGFLLSLNMISFSKTPAAEAKPDIPLKNLFNSPIEEVEPSDEHIVDFEDLVEEVGDAVDMAVEQRMDAPLSTHEITFEQAVMRDHAFLKGKNYYEIFGLSRNTFSFDALKAAYFNKSKQYSPEKFMMLSGPTQTLAEDILSILSTAYNTLSNVVSKERYDEMLNADTVGLDGKQDGRLQAQVQLQSGKVFLEMHEFENAQKALQDAFSLNPQSAEAAAFFAWALYKNPASKGSKAARDKARSLLSKSLQLKNNADAFAFRGWLLLDEGREELAEGEFQKALKLNPKEPNARKGMAQITEKREAENKGLFKKIFG